ncbi:Uncharacterized protein TCM_001189 isoform 2, partial [Theobroma cacao]
RSSPLVYSRKEFSTSPGKNATPKPRPPESKSGLSKVVLGSAIIGGAVLVAYRAGYLDQYLGENPKVPIDSKKIGFDEKDEKDIQVVSVDLPEQKVPTHIDLPPQPETSSETQGEIQFTVEDKSNETLGENIKPVPEKELPEYSPSSLPSADHSADAAVSAEGNLKKVESETTTIPNKEIQDTPVDNQSSVSLGETKTVPSPTTADRQQDEPSKGVELPSLAPEESQIKTVPSLHPTTADIAEDKPSKDIEAPSSLLDAYHLREKADESYLTSLNRKYEQLSKETEAFGTAIEELNEGYLSKDGKLILDFLQAIHAAEKRQAELDVHAFAEEKRAMKEKYEKELRDLRARELMRTEEAAILDKELKRERTKAAAAIKSLQEKMEEKLKMEIEEKEREAEMKLQKAQELGKAELAAAIASEKAAQIEKMAEANLHAHIATWLKVKEVDHSGEGIESVISTVDNYLAEGKLAEAAAALEQGVKGSQAEEIVGDWVKRVRNRAITEQALAVLQSYATCISLT